MARSDLTAALLRAMLNYNPDTGHLTWRDGYARADLAGRRAGGMGTGGSAGYRVIGFGKYGIWMESRLAWLHHHGEHPAGVVDHINGIRDDNRICNLRDVTQAQNLQNIKQARSNNRSGYLGVQIQKDGRYIAEIYCHRVRHYLGSFTCPKEAHAAYLEAKRRLHVTCTI